MAEAPPRAPPRAPEGAARRPVAVPFLVDPRALAPVAARSLLGALFCGLLPPLQ